MNQINSTQNLILEHIDKQDISTMGISNIEKETIRLIGQGVSNIQIANKLGLSSGKIEKIIVKLLDKTNTRNSAHLMMYAAVNNILDI